MRIISGKYRGLKLQPPVDFTIRPTSDRLKESLFSMLESNKYNIKIENSNVIDICSGTGALGIEALSRGAKLIYFIDKDPKAINVLQKNISKLKIDYKNETYIKIIRDDANKALQNIKNNFDIVLIDPPYNSNVIEECLVKLKQYNLINFNSYIFAESSKNENINFDGFDLLDTKIYGKSKLTILQLLNSRSVK
ncbi:16S rRNA (guanine(966)-N(2))-methyltransferase RsmD [Alphaproteobacteria bacterium]|nr:16S rRNA (guanine(966)-N(2))-methyltransferase RsmD [Alphaproteobacteria bacterium]